MKQDEETTSYQATRKSSETSSVPANAFIDERPAQTWSLKFRDRDLERAFLDVEYDRNRRLLAIGCSVVAAIVASFLWLDPILAPPEVASVIASARLFFGLPIAVMVVVGALVLRDVRAWMIWYVAFTVLYAWQTSAVLLVAGTGAFQYQSYNIWQGLIATFFLSGLPLRWSIWTGSACSISFALTAAWVRVSVADFVNYFAVDVAIVFALSAFATYRYDRASREQFIAQGLTRRAHAAQLAVEADRRRWLEVIAGFLRHELKNAMTGVRSSLDLASRIGGDAPVRTYVDRAQRSVQYMHRLLAQVADATSLESALKQQDSESFDFSTLLKERIEDFRNDHRERSFETDIERGVRLTGSPDAIQQLIDKLINNALEHGEEASPIHIQLYSESDDCRLVVSDRGDELVGDVEELFQPFVTRKPRRKGSDSLGLGLFVARTIAMHHGGAVWAEPLSSESGARFVVRLPRRT